MTRSGDLLWEPSRRRRESSLLSRFAEIHCPQASSFAELHSWSVKNPGEFWTAVWQFAQVQGSLEGPALQGSGMRGTTFFPEARLNFARNLLERGRPDDLAIQFRSEDGRKTVWTREELKFAAAGIARALKKQGVEPGDRVAAVLPNRPETVAAMLATASIGAVWSSCSPEFGLAALVDRFEQLAPTVLLTVSDYRYGGKLHDCRRRIGELISSLPSVRKIYCLTDDLDLPEHPRLAAWPAPDPTAGLPYRELPFNHPLYVLFSSGTTGAPKGIVHGAGGTLLQHLKEHQLHCDIQPDSRVFYYTTCGWMMWNWLVSALASEASLMLYEGSPFHPDANALFDFAQSGGSNFFGVSARFLDTCRSRRLRPTQTHDTSAIQTIASTGSPLSSESFNYVYEAIKPDVALHSISGGTDIVSCFVLGNPWQSVHSGEIVGPGLGMAVEVWDDEGLPSPPGSKGDLVCTQPFPCMPLAFWGDTDGSRYTAAYFGTYPDVWHHGDFAEWRETGGYVIHGRSDATLNPGGVRIGTAEIYREISKIPCIVESLAIGQEWEGDTRIVLFVVLQPGCVLDITLVQQVNDQIRNGATPRHVPAKILQVRDLPRTRSGKLAELAVRALVHGEPVRNRHALANPESLEQFTSLPALQTA